MTACFKRSSVCAIRIRLSRKTTEARAISPISSPRSWSVTCTASTRASGAAKRFMAAVIRRIGWMMPRARAPAINRVSAIATKAAPPLHKTTFSAPLWALRVASSRSCETRSSTRFIWSIFQEARSIQRVTILVERDAFPDVPRNTPARICSISARLSLDSACSRKSVCSRSAKKRNCSRKWDCRSVNPTNTCRALASSRGAEK